MDATLDLLLKAELPAAPTKEIRIKRLSEMCGGDILFSLRALSYSRVAEIKETSSEDMQIHILLAGVTAPNLKDPSLLEKYHAVTPVELVKAMLLPGEIEDVSREIERLSGYRGNTIEDVKKK